MMSGQRGYVQPMTYQHQPLFPLADDATRYRQIATDGVRLERVGSQDLITVDREAMRRDGTGDDRHQPFAALLRRGGVLPMRQDTGTAIVMAKKGRLIFTDGSDESAIAEGIRDAYAKKNLRYSLSFCHFHV
jgi:fumarate hydratase, class I